MGRKLKKRSHRDILIEVRREYRIPRARLAEHFESEKEDIIEQLEQNATDDQFSPKQRADFTEACKLMRALQFAQFLHGWFIPGYAEYAESSSFDDPGDPDAYNEFITEEMDSIYHAYLRTARQQRIAKVKA